MGPPPGYQPYGQGMGIIQPLRKATTAMVCGIIGLLVCNIILAPVALGLGISAKGEIDRNPGRYSNRGQATAAIVLGIIGICLIPISFIILSRVKK